MVTVILLIVSYVLRALAPACKEFQNYAKSFDFVTRELLVQMMNEAATDDHVRQYLVEVFGPRILKARAQWTISRSASETGIANLNPHLTQGQVKQLVRRLPWDLGQSSGHPGRVSLH